MNQIYFVLQQALGLSARKQTEGFAVPKSPRSINTSHVTAFLAVMLFTCLGAYAQTDYYSKATATDFNDVNSWGTATDGTGTAPAAISNADNFIVANSAALTLSGNATVRQLTINAGSVTITANTLTVSRATGNNATMTVANGGSFAISGGNLFVNGNIAIANGGNFAQSGGIITVDGNNGGSTTGSVATGTPHFGIGTSAVAYTTGTASFTGGTLILVDPAPTTGTDYVFYTYLPTTSRNITATTGHTLQIGDGVSTDAGGNATNGYYLYFWPGTGAFKAGNFVVNAPAGTNRHVSQQYRSIVGGNLTVITGELRYNATNYYVAGNITVNPGATLTATVLITLGDANYTGGTSVAEIPSTVAQTVGGGGTFRNLVTAPTANFTSLTINNSSTGGVTFSGTSNIATQPANSMSVSGTLTLTSGRAYTATGASVVLGVSGSTTGTLAVTAGGFGSGATFGRWVSAAGTGSAFTAGTDVTTLTSRYPFITAAGANRSAWIERVTPASAAGVLAMTYNEAAGTSAINVTDGAYTANLKTNDTWSVSALSGTPLAAATFKVQLQAPGIFGLTPSAANVRVIQGNTFVGTHQNGTVTPGGQRVGLTAAELTAAPFSLAINSSDFPLASVASGNWNDPAIWSSGAVPTCTDAVQIAAGHTVTVNSTINEVKAVTINTGATLIVASGDLTVGCTLYNNTLTNNGTLTVSGGTLNVNGNLNNALTTSVFNQSGGMIVIDGNDGVAANSVASGTALFRSASTAINLTGGTLMFVDPHLSATNNSNYTMLVTNGTASTVPLASSPAHITQFGDGSSTTAGGSAGGFYVNTWDATAFMSFGSVAVNGGSGTNRGLTSRYNFAANGDVTVDASSTMTIASFIIGGNLTVDGTFVNTTGTVAAVIASNDASNLTFAPVLNAQTITNNGTIANLATAPTANFASFVVNNTSAAGLTLASPIRVSGTLTLTAGKVNTDVDNILTLGTATAAGTLTGGSATAYINGPFERTIANNNANTNYILFPVGKAAYAPIWLAPATTSVAVMRAEAFDSNTGTAGAAIMDLAANRRWEAPLVSGTVTNVNVRLGGTFVADNIPVMANAAAGQYTNTFGSTSTFVAGPPTTIQSTTPVAAGDYTGFISYAKSNLCSGTPAPGNTIASSTSICLGASVTLSVQNATTGSGVSYRWQSSTDGINFTDIDSATSATLSVTPLVPTYYQLKVTCSAGPSTGISTPVFIQFTNSITASSGATRCGAGVVNLGATGTPGSTVSWYATQTGGTAIATGETYSPTVSATTTFYASAGVASTVTTPVGAVYSGTTNNGTSTGSHGILITTTAPNFTIVSAKIPFTGTGNITVQLQSSTGTMIATTTATGVTGQGTTPVTVPLNINVAAAGSYRLIVTGITGTIGALGYSTGTYPYTAFDGKFAVTNGYWFGSTASNMYLFELVVEGIGVCEGPRVPVTATINTPPALTLSTNTVTICNGATSAPVTITAGSTDYDNYNWTPSAGVSGNAVTGWTFNPTVSGTYTLNASQSTGDLCTAIATVAVTVNAVPSALTIANSGATNTCIGTIQSLTATGGFAPGTVTIGTGTTTTTATEELTAFNNRRVTYKMQSIYTAAELLAAGLRPGPITSLAFNIATVGDASTTTAYTLKLGSTTNDVFAGTTYISDAAFTTVYGPVTNTHAVGVNTINFTTPYIWDGTSNIVVNVTHGGIDNINNAQTFYSTTTGNTTLYNYNSVANTASNKRFNVIFGGLKASDVTWTPATNLYTDAAATTAYVAGSATNMVYVKPAAAGSVQYTATVGTTCPVTATVTISAVDCAIGWGNLQWPPSATINTCGAETVYGKVWKENITEAAGAHPNMKAWVGISTTNTDPSTWTEAQWNAAEYNVQVDNDDEYKYTISGLAAGTYYYAFRYQYLTGSYWYGGYNPGGGGAWNGTSNVNGMLTVNAIALPTASDQAVCTGATVANLSASGTGLKWYNVATNGTALASTDVITAGTYYVSQTIDGCESARVAVAVTISTFDAPVATVTQPTCTVATGTITVTSLGTGYTYSINGTDFQSELEFANVTAGTYTLTAKNSIGCTASASVTVNAQPIAPVADDPADVAACNSYVLPALSPGNSYYTATNGGGTMLMAGQVITTNQVIYVFAESGGCSDEDSFTVTINQAPDLGTVSDVTACGSYTLPNRTVGNYYTAQNGGGTMLTAGTVITTNQTIYVYAESGTTPNCTAEESFDVIITTAPAQPTGASTQTITVADPADATIEDLQATAATGIISWYLTEADALSGTGALAPGTQLTNGTYYATAAVGTCYSTTALAVTVDVALGRDDFSFTNLKYYPNPVTDRLTIAHSAAITSVEVYNMLGQLVISQRPGTATADVNMSQLQEATYIVRISAEGKSKDFKVIKK